MKTKAFFLNHPIHPMLIVFPMGLLIFSFICHLIDKFSTADVWHTVALYTMGGGIIGAAIAVIPGLIDLFDLPQSKARTVAIFHMLTNVVMLTIFIIAFFVDISNYSEAISFLLSLIGVILLGISGWLGGELVYHYGIGVATDENNVSVH